MTHPLILPPAPALASLLLVAAAAAVVTFHIARHWR